MANQTYVFNAKYNNSSFYLSSAPFQEKAEEIGVSCIP